MPDAPSGEVKAKDDLKKDVKVKGSEAGQSDFWKKYKWWIIGGVIVVILFVVWYIHKQGSSATTAANATQDQSNIDPATGYPYGSPADLAALGSAGSVVPTSIG